MTVRYAIVLSKLAQDTFDRLMQADRKRGEQIAKAIDRLALNPNLGEFLKGEWKGYHKYRTGDYRIIYRVEHHKLLIYVITIGDRKDDYR